MLLLEKRRYSIRCPERSQLYRGALSSRSPSLPSRFSCMAIDIKFNQAQTPSPQLRSKLRRIPSNSTVASLLTRTNTTVSGIPGAGRTVGRIIWAGGRCLERVLGRGAELLGYGPNAVRRRLLAHLQHEHVRSESHRQRCGISAAKALFSGVPEISGTIILAVIYLVCHPCPGCGFPVLSDFAVGQDCRVLLLKLLRYARFVAYTIKKPTTLATLTPGFGNTVTVSPPHVF